MNKGELIAKLAERAGMTKKDARKALDTLIDIIIEAVSKNEEVLLTGFGKFEARARKESQRINPQTQQRIKVPSKVVPVFRPGRNFKEAVQKRLKAVTERGQLKIKRA